MTAGIAHREGEHEIKGAIAHRDGKMSGANGLTIYWQAWMPRVIEKAVLVISHGLGEHSGRYLRVAERLVAEGCAVYAIDHRGHGRSDGPRALVDRFANAVADLDQLVERARSEHRGLPLVLLGHSMGGALALQYALTHQNKLDALILSAPAVALDGASAATLMISKALSALAPSLGMVPIDPSKVSRDQAEVAAYAHDALNFHGKIPARTLGELVRFVEWLPAQVSSLTLPLLVMHGTGDVLAGVAGSERVVQGAKSVDKSLKLYDGLYHEIFNELPEARERVFADMTAWIAAHRGAR